MTKERKCKKSPGGHTVSKLCSQWEMAVRYQVKPTTYAVYITVIEKHILPELGHYRAEELDNWILDQYLQTKKREGLSWSTMRLNLFFLSWRFLFTSVFLDPGLCLCSPCQLALALPDFPGLPPK